MSRNSSGVYSLPPGTAAVQDEIGTASQFNTRFDDLAADANATRPIIAGGTGANTATAARVALGVEIGNNVQAHDAGLTSIASLTTAADRMIYTTAADTYAVAPLTAAGRSVAGASDAAGQRTAMGLGTASVAALIDSNTFDGATTGNAASAASIKAYVDAAVAGLSPVQFSESPEQTLSGGGEFTFAHGFASTDISVDYFLICKFADAGYSPGQRVNIGPLTTGNYGFGAAISSTSVTVRFGAQASPIVITNGANGVSAVANNASWRMVVRVKK